MEKQQFKNTVLSMIHIENEFENLLDKAINSGCLDIEGTQEDNYANRKSLICAIYKSLSDNWKPLTNEGKKELTNISKFI